MLARGRWCRLRFWVNLDNIGRSELGFVLLWRIPSAVLAPLVLATDTCLRPAELCLAVVARILDSHSNWFVDSFALHLPRWLNLVPLLLVELEVILFEDGLCFL